MSKEEGRTWMSHDVEWILEQQARYYEDRAPEYEDVWYRRGRYDLGPDGNARWFEETARLEAAVESFGATGQVLELACGTGLFTRQLATRATRLTALDASAAVLAVNRERIGDPSLEYVCADLFEWEPSPAHRYDVIFSSFLISHIPPPRFDAFWDRLRRWLAPGGRVFFCDDVAGGTARPSNPGESVDKGPHFAHRRRLHDGREYTIVKVFHRPERLTAALAKLGWTADVSTTGDEFLYGTATT
jgi:demethylmenaquinone methyltransferase/2-methoxy-6-polyprenyl-1,4-benzoquinol methylase